MGIARHFAPLSTRWRTASTISRWQEASGRPPRPSSRAGTGIEALTWAHSASVMSGG